MSTSSIIASRLNKHLNSFGIDEQCGMKGCCADATFTIKTALQTLREHDQEAYVLFVDLVKAYDTVNRELLWKTMEKLGVPKKFIQVFHKLYEKVEYHMNLLGKKTSFMSSCGVKQGDNLGPILFLYIVQAVVTTLDDKWQFTKPNFRWHGNNADGQPKKFSDLNKKVKHTTKGTIFEYFKSFYVDDAAFIIMRKE
jgi:hypothetical protein